MRVKQHFFLTFPSSLWGGVNFVTFLEQFRTKCILAFANIICWHSNFITLPENKTKYHRECSTNNSKQYAFWWSFTTILLFIKSYVCGWWHIHFPIANLSNRDDQTKNIEWCIFAEDVQSRSHIFIWVQFNKINVLCKSWSRNQVLGLFNSRYLRLVFQSSPIKLP